MRLRKTRTTLTKVDSQLLENLEDFLALGALKQKSAEDTVDINTYANRVKGLSR